MAARPKLPDSWDALPNALLINQVIDHVQDHMTLWADAWCRSSRASVTDSAKVEAEIEAWKIIQAVAGRDAIARAAINRAGEVCWVSMRSWAEYEAEIQSSEYQASCVYVRARETASSMILAMIAWDDCAELLNLSLDQLRMLDRLGHPAAILMWPAATVLPRVNLTNNAISGILHTLNKQDNANDH